MKQHRLWIALIVCAVAIMTGSGPLAGLLRKDAVRDLTMIQSARAKTGQDLKQLRDNVAAARKLAGEIDRAEAEQVLAPSDRLKAASMFENEAAQGRLSHFTYTLAPEERVAIDAGGEKHDLAVSIITLSADAPDDVYIYSSLERMRQSLPGRARLQQLSISRPGNPDALAAQNVHFEATLEWLSNGTLQTAGNQ